MVLPLFALGLLTAGTGIAKGIYDETQEQKRRQKMLESLYGPSVQATDSILNPQVGPPTAQTSAYMQLARARAKDDPFGAVEWAQSLAPKPKELKAVPKGSVLVDDQGNVAFENKDDTRPSPDMLQIYGRNGKLLAEVDKNDPEAVATWKGPLSRGEVTSVKPEKADKPQPMTAMAKLDADLKNGFLTEEQYKSELDRISKPNQKLTDAQEKTRGYHSVVTGAESELNNLLTGIATEKRRFKEDGSPDISTSIADVVPSAYQLYLPSRTRPEFLNSNQLRYLQSADEWTTAVLRDESGATIGDQERADAYVTYFPLKGDSKEVIEAKQRSRIRKMQSMAGKFANGERAQTYNPMTGNFE